MTSLGVWTVYIPLDRASCAKPKTIENDEADLTFGLSCSGSR